MSADQDINIRDGTSQAGRMQPALDPDYVSVDERTIQDLLAFAREYAKELRYFDVKDGRLHDAGDWSGFLGADGDLDKVAAFLENPQEFSSEQSRDYNRPHFALFLTFLQLLRHAQEQLNGLTRRHLDYYYQQVLQMHKRPGIPDHVHVLAELAPGVEQMLLPAGSLLNAGSDSQGQPLVYNTDEDIVVTQAQVERQRTIFVDRRITGIREAREKYKNFTGNAILEMLQIPFGRPTPGDSLPPYPAEGEGAEIDYDFLLTLKQLLDFTPNDLFMDFADLRTLVKLKNQWLDSDGEWDQINQLLQKAGRQKRNNPEFKLKTENIRDFETNIELAMGAAPNFDGLPDVENLNHLYDQRNRDSVKQFIRGLEPYDEKGLHFEDIGDFITMMQIKIRLANEWAEINRILAAAGQFKGTLDKDHPFPSRQLYEPGAFTSNLEAALNPDYAPLSAIFPAVKDLDTYHKALLELESFFFMPVEDFAILMSIAEKWQVSEPDPTRQEWDNVYAILGKAYRARVYATFSKARLREEREEKGFVALIDYLLGDDQSPAAEDRLPQFLAFVQGDEEYALLEEINKAVKSEVPVEEADWQEVYRILELAQRARLGDPVPQKEEWFNLYPEADATQATVELGVSGESDHPRWKTFGRRTAVTGQENPPPLNLGWAITSPMLVLSQGRRTITLTLGFQAESFDTLNATAALFQSGDNPFQIELSTEKGWVQPRVGPIQSGDYHDLSRLSSAGQDRMAGIQIKLIFDEDVDPLTPLPDAAGEIKSPWPLLRLRLKQLWQSSNGSESAGRMISHYHSLKNLILCRTHLRVDVSGLLPAQLQNDETTLDPQKPFEPFGSSPTAGSRFYLGHPEIISKKLDSLKFRYQWMDLPAGGLTGHYLNYPLKSDIDSKGFKARVILVDNRVETTLWAEAPLFNKDSDVNAGNTQGEVESFIIPLPPAAPATGKAPGAHYDRANEVITDEQLPAWNRYLLWELKAPDFQHSTYPTVAVNKSVALAAAIAKDPEKVSAAQYQVNPPYTPKMKALQIDYTATQEIQMEAFRPGRDMDRLFHLHPFGYSEFQYGDQVSLPRFLPQYDFEGELYIGIRGGRPPQNISLLFQMAEGSANPDVQSVSLAWSYLSGNCWLSLDGGHVLRDSTRDLINSGIILLDLPPANPNTLLDPDLYWIRAAIPRHSDSVCDTVAIHAQAISATFTTQDNAPDHLSRPLPAGSIAGLVDPIPEFTGFRQPYTSFGGKMAERDSSFYTRISERIRHKQRALTIWDYERLILERFPQLYKVKCLPAGPERLGKITIIVIPDIRNKLPFDPFQPKAPSGLLADVKAYLEDKIPPLATIEVKNAHYVPLKVRIGVRFRSGYNEGFYRQKLIEEINQFLSPWAYDGGAEIVIGGRIYANVIINFIEEREYVDYAAQIKLFKNDEYIMPPAEDGYWVGTEQSDEVLVAARQHVIDTIPEAGYEEEAFIGINYMKIELDFIVA